MTVPMMRSSCHTCEGSGQLSVNMDDMIQICFDSNFMENKINAIKAIRDYAKQNNFHFGLRDTKHFVEKLQEVHAEFIKCKLDTTSKDENVCNCYCDDCFAGFHFNCNSTTCDKS